MGVDIIFNNNFNNLNISNNISIICYIKNMSKKTIAILLTILMILIEIGMVLLLKNISIIGAIIYSIIGGAPIAFCINLISKQK